MGFGHRVYKNFDPRAKIIKKAADNVLDKLGVNDPVLELAKKLEKIGINTEVINCRFIKPMDNGYLKTIVSRGIINVLTIEEGVIDGGFGDGVSSFLVENGFKYHSLVMGKPRGGNYHWIDNHLVKATRYNGKFTDLVEKNVTIQVFKD